jgi:hypothetical protein
LNVSIQIAKKLGNLKKMREIILKSMLRQYLTTGVRGDKYSSEP